MRMVAAMLIGLAFFACLITQPPGDPPAAQPRRPAILHDQVSPKLTEPLTMIQGNTVLVVPVESDPQAPLEWRLFLDFDPVNGGVQLLGDRIPPDQTLPPTRVVSVPLSVVDGLDTALCHSLTLRVAQTFSTQSPWTPLSPGGDDATWFYRPNGNAAPCPGYDAGAYADAAAFDTGTE